MTTKITEKNISSLANAGVQWQAVITADGSTTTTGVAGRGYFIDTTSFTHSFNLPSSATAGDTIIVKDYAKTFDTNKLTVSGNGNNIEGVNVAAEIATEGQSTTFVYIDSTKGWVIANEGKSGNITQPLFISATGGTITTSGNFKIHSFTGDGCFAVLTLGNSPTVPTGGPSNVDYLVIAGGGAGGSGHAGGGGAGGYRTTFPSPGCNAGSFPISAQTYPITVGAGGSAVPTVEKGTNGSNSVFSTITSTGGGGGGSFSNISGSSGGSGGAGAGGAAAGTAGSGNTPPTSPSQGNNAGGGNSTGVAGHGGGGGGAAGTGGNASPPANANEGASGSGGNGSANSITASPVTYAGGGSGGRWGNNTIGTVTGGGGLGGGSGGAGGTGTANTGGGGGGGGDNSSAGGAGGKGIVVIRYKFQ